MEFIIFLSLLGLGFICATIAGKRGRSESLAMVLGFSFGIFAIITYLIMGKKVAENKKI
jgi:hypothetical protein